MSKSNDELVTYEEPSQVVINELFNYDAYRNEPPRLMFFVDGILFYKSSGTSNKTPIFSDTFLPCFGILPNENNKIYYTINDTILFEEDNHHKPDGLIIKKTLPVDKKNSLFTFKKLWTCIINKAFIECNIIKNYTFRKAEKTIKQIKGKVPSSDEYKSGYEYIINYICFSWIYNMLTKIATSYFSNLYEIVISFQFGDGFWERVQYNKITEELYNSLREQIYQEATKYGIPIVTYKIDENIELTQLKTLELAVNQLNNTEKNKYLTYHENGDIYLEILETKLRERCNYTRFLVDPTTITILQDTLYENLEKNTLDIIKDIFIVDDNTFKSSLPIPRTSTVMSQLIDLGILNGGKRRIKRVKNKRTTKRMKNKRTTKRMKNKKGKSRKIKKTKKTLTNNKSNRNKI
jgi:hypothetical protein